VDCVRRRVAIRIILLIFLSAFVFVALPAGAARRPPVARKPKLAKARTNVAPKPLRHVVQVGHTLTGILIEQGLSPREIAQWDEAMRTAAGNFQLSPGHVLNLRFARPGLLASLSYEVDDCVRVLVERRGKQLRGRTEPLQARVKMVAAEGLVQKNFLQAAHQADIPNAIVSRMADILGWEYDFRRVKPGDRFRVLYERRVSADGRPLPPGKVLAAEIRGAYRIVQAFYYDDGGQGIYVDGKGRTLAQGFLRYPVEFTRISSHFSRQRFHPILQTSRPHNGVDLAAPQGTPVRAAGDGVVAMAGRNGDYGNHIEIKHENGWVTTYSHLNGIASGLRPGQTVRQGTVIGFVGQTGLATGAHLHFALFRNGEYLNPLTAKVELRRDVRDPKRFALAKQALLRQIASIVRPATPVEPVIIAGLPPSQRPGPITITQ
jgi:murein DD-endopeptidase MepM/ murein hydrolase activator NlpD